MQKWAVIIKNGQMSAKLGSFIKNGQVFAGILKMGWYSQRGGHSKKWTVF